MGCDGGTIPTRDELVRLKQKPEKVDRDVEISARWRHCALSQQQLREPIVCCELGRLYNKEAVIEYLLNKASASSDIAAHIRNLKDVCELKLTKNTSYDRSCLGKADTYVDTQASEYICPITGLEMNGRYKFVFLWKNGFVCSERGLKEVPDAVHQEWGEGYNKDDVIAINGSKEEMEELRKKMDFRRAQAKMEKKGQKGKKRERAEAAVKSEQLDNPCSKSKKIKSSTKQNGTVKPTSVTMSGNSDLGLGTVAEARAALKQSSHFKTVAEDPKASKTLKSLFSSSAKPRDKDDSAHWVTYNPYHYAG
ncbi:replication termination factor 2-like isoform X2 [Corticium candelabrum]|uniref:replication termination factor 2-like isoform X2 n=1 Tax=Corticium candelabrum TaxID=121492 RepID=UPI002E26A2B6|nr:replication termination factor 2-like isoform X2 [Corticium candelabrum]